MAKVGELLIDVRAGVAQLQKDLGKATALFGRAAADMGKALRKGMSAQAIGQFGEVASKAARAAADAFKALIEAASTEQLNANLDKLSTSWESFKVALGSSITQSEAFNVALNVLTEWLNEAAEGAKGMGTAVGDVLGGALILVRAPLIVFNGLLAALHGWLALFFKFWAGKLGFLGKVADALGMDGVAGAIGEATSALRNLSSDNLDLAKQRAEAAAKGVEKVADGLDRVNAASGQKSDSKVVGRGKDGKGGGGKGAGKAGPSAVWAFDALAVNESDGSAQSRFARGDRIAAGNMSGQAARDLADNVSAAMPKLEQLQGKLEEMRNASVELGTYMTDALVDGLFMPLEDGFNGFADIMEMVKNMAIDLIKQLIKAAILKFVLNSATGGIGGSLLTLIGLAEGGMVRGPGSSTSDSIPARLSNGEYVVQAAAVQKYGASFFDAINSMKPQAFASGGLVGGGLALAGGGAVSGGGSATINVVAFDPATMLQTLGRAVEPAQLRRLQDRQGSKIREATRRAAAKPRSGW